MFGSNIGVGWCDAVGGGVGDGMEFDAGDSDGGGVSVGGRVGDEIGFDVYEELGDSSGLGVGEGVGDDVPTKKQTSAAMSAAGSEGWLVGSDVIAESVGAVWSATARPAMGSTRASEARSATVPYRRHEIKVAM